MTTRSEGQQHNRLYAAFIGQPVERWYLHNLDEHGLTTQQCTSIRRQATIGWLQTLLLLVVLVQILFAGLLRALPQDLRVALSFLHRIEWGAYVGIALIALQAAVGWAAQIVLTNRIYALAWRLGKPRIVVGARARRVQISYLLVIVLMVITIVWVRLHGFIVQPGG